MDNRNEVVTMGGNPVTLLGKGVKVGDKGLDFTVLKDDINLLLFILNMLPIYPLDGGRALKIFLPRTQPVLGFAFLVLLTICSAYILIEFKIFGLFAVCIYLWMVNLRLI